jgi:Dyp-type peroxidase family
MTLFSPSAPQLTPPLLDDLQGNILRGFARDRALLCFVRFSEDRAKTRAFLGHLLDAKSPLKLSSAAAQEQANPSAAPLVAAMFSAVGLGRAGLPERALARMGRAFMDGSRAPYVRASLNDRPADEWEAAHRAPWDAVILIGCSIDDQDRMRAALESHAAELQALHIEQGTTLDHKGRTAGKNARTRYEHFGYRDGLSQPLYWAGSSAKHKGRDPDQHQPLNTLLAPDLASGSWGSYFVFRKLEQDVTGFHARVKERAQELQQRGAFLAELYAEKMGGSAFDAFGPNGHLRNAPLQKIEEFVMARMMGRAPDGEPVVGRGAHLNDFDYEKDQGGGQCPFSAHVRKANPRGSSGRPDEAQRIIARRSWPYGSAETGGPRGLLFLCAQADIAEQFEFIQGSWANGQPTDFASEPTPGPDYLTNQAPPILEDYTVRDRYARYAQTIDVDLRMGDLITLQASEYLFAPSLSGLAAMVEGKVAP